MLLSHLLSFYFELLAKIFANYSVITFMYSKILWKCCVNDLSPKLYGYKFKNYRKHAMFVPLAYITHTMKWVERINWMTRSMNNCIWHGIISLSRTWSMFMTRTFYQSFWSWKCHMMMMMLWNIHIQNMKWFFQCKLIGCQFV